MTPPSPTRLALPVTLAATLAIALAVPCVSRAEDAAGGRPGDEGFSLMEEGGKLLFRHMLRRMKPALDDAQNDLGATLNDMAPALRELSDYVGDLSLYQLPEVLPNGDVLIRRKVPLPAPPVRLGVPNADGTVDL
jgi:hypothetical protein